MARIRLLGTGRHARLYRELCNPAASTSIVDGRVRSGAEFHSGPASDVRSQPCLFLGDFSSLEDRHRHGQLGGFRIDLYRIVVRRFRCVREATRAKDSIPLRGRLPLVRSPDPASGMALFASVDVATPNSLSSMPFGTHPHLLTCRVLTCRGRP